MELNLVQLWRIRTECHKPWLDRRWKVLENVYPSSPKAIQVIVGGFVGSSNRGWKSRVARSKSSIRRFVSSPWLCNGFFWLLHAKFMHSLRWHTGWPCAHYVRGCAVCSHWNIEKRMMRELGLAWLLLVYPWGEIINVWLQGFLIYRSMYTQPQISLIYLITLQLLGAHRITLVTCMLLSKLHGLVSSILLLSTHEGNLDGYLNHRRIRSSMYCGLKIFL